MLSNFETYLDVYSGYTQFTQEMNSRFSVNDFEMSAVDKKAWIVERFTAENKQTPMIEGFYNAQLSAGRTGGSATRFSLTEVIESEYNGLLQRLESSFALQSVFKEPLSSLQHDAESDRFMIQDASLFNRQVGEYV